MSGRPINEDRAVAIDLGYPTYIGLPHSACGTTERYTKGGGCVHCARIIATEQREARRLLKQQARAEIAIEDAHDEDVADDLFALDTSPETAIEEPDVPDVETEAEARARFEESIEDLM